MTTIVTEQKEATQKCARMSEMTDHAHSGKMQKKRTNPKGGRRAVGSRQSGSSSLLGISSSGSSSVLSAHSVGQNVI
jgi:hypothetical protein